MKPDVHLLYFEGCPNVGKARENLRAALAQARLPVHWTEIDLHSPESPSGWRGFPSPTVLIDGKDVVSGAESSTAASSCRFGGAPDAGTIAAKLRDHSWLASLATVPAAVMGMFPTLICPACYPAVAGFLGAVGLGAIADDRMIAPVTGSCLAIALAGLAYQAWRKREVGPLLLGFVGAAGIYAGLFMLNSSALKAAGIAVLIAASLWNVMSKRNAGKDSCPACVQIKEVRNDG